MGEYEENRFRCTAIERRCEISVPNHSDRNRRGKRDNDPGHGDMRSLADFLCIADCHETYEDMWLSKIAKPPSDKRYEADERYRTAISIDQWVEEIRIYKVYRRGCIVYAAKGIDGHARNDNDRKKHHDTLYEVRCCNGKETSCKRVEYHNTGAEKNRYIVWQMEDRLKQLSTCDKT